MQRGTRAAPERARTFSALASNEGHPAAVFDDVLSLLLLAVLTALISAGEAPGLAELALLGFEILAFFAATAVVGLHAFPWGNKILRHVKEKEPDFSAMLIAALAFAVLAESAAVGIGMSARGAVELVIAGIALEAGLFSPPGVDSRVLANLFSTIVIMAIITTVVTPVLLKRIYAR